jgi:hypothetical protein
MNTRTIIGAGVLGVMALTAGTAGASHKSWLRLDSGNTCVNLDGNATGVTANYEAVWNPAANATFVICPVKLGGTFTAKSKSSGAFDPQINQHTKVPSMNARVYYWDGNPNDVVSCGFRAITSTGAVHITPVMQSCATAGGCSVSTPSSSFVGAGYIEFADATIVPDRRIGVDHADTASDIRSYAVQCLVGAAGPSGWSGITAVATRICMRDPALWGHVCWTV